MSRVLTGLNPRHPKARLTAYLQKMFSEYRSLSNADLEKVFVAECPEDAPQLAELTRKQRIDLLLKEQEHKFKIQWKQSNGWDFDECLDQAQWDARCEKIKAEYNPPYFDTLRIRDVRGRVLTSRAEFDVLPEREQQEIRGVINLNIERLRHAGWLGSLAGQDGKGELVDRRLHPTALPVPANAELGISPPQRMWWKPRQIADLAVTVTRWMAPEDPIDVPPSNSWCRVRSVDGTYDLNWFPKPPKVGPVMEVQYCWATPNLIVKPALALAKA